MLRAAVKCSSTPWTYLTLSVRPSLPRRGGALRRVGLEGGAVCRGDAVALGIPEAAPELTGALAKLGLSLPDLLVRQISQIAPRMSGRELSTAAWALATAQRREATCGGGLASEPR